MRSKNGLSYQHPQFKNSTRKEWQKETKGGLRRCRLLPGGDIQRIFYRITKRRFAISSDIVYESYTVLKIRAEELKSALTEQPFLRITRSYFDTMELPKFEDIQFENE